MMITNMMQAEFYQQADIPNNFIRHWQNFAKNRLALGGLIILSFFILVALLAPVIAPYDPARQFTDFLAPPSWYENSKAQFLLGTDDLGRDIFSRLLYGARLSLKLAFYVVAAAGLIGIALGSIAALSHRWINHLVIRAMDLLLALPSLLLAIVIVAIIGAGLPNAIYAVAIVLIPHFVLVTNNAIEAEVNKEYVTAAILDGTSKFRLFTHTIFPNILPHIIIQVTVALSIAILDIAALGFLGLGAQPPNPEWGTILSESRNNIMLAPWTVTLPGLCIFFVLMSINLVGDGLRDAIMRDN